MVLGSQSKLPTKLAKFSERQVRSSGDTYQERSTQQTSGQGGFLLVALAESEVLMEGLAFLKNDESTWPAAPPPRDNTKRTEHRERRTTTRAHATRSHAIVIINPNKFSSLKHLVHVTGWVQRFLTNCRLPMDLQRKDRILLPTKISKAETFWIKQAQAQNLGHK